MAENFPSLTLALTPPGSIVTDSPIARPVSTYGRPGAAACLGASSSAR